MCGRWVDVAKGSWGLEILLLSGARIRARGYLLNRINASIPSAVQHTPHSCRVILTKTNNRSEGGRGKGRKKEWKKEKKSEERETEQVSVRVHTKNNLEYSMTDESVK
jgi:hypothetical protein